MIILLGFAEIILLLFFFLLERRFPARTHNRVPYWNVWFCGIALFSLVWLKLLFYVWVTVDDTALLSLDEIAIGYQVLVFYATYSLGNYWFHRWKHTSHLLWRCLHRFHHSPAHMETLVAFYRHPLEIFANTIYIILLGKILFGASTEVVAIALAIEASLEIFHHSNIRIAKRYRWIGYIIQIPEMHLVHHQKGLHRYNYATCLWDTIFGTIYIPRQWNGKVGFADSAKTGKLFLLKQADES